MKTFLSRSHTSTVAAKTADTLKTRVLEGLEAGEFCMAYQGIYRVDSGELAQMEALIRWRHPEFGVLLPGAFHEALEDEEVMLEVTDFVMNAVSHDIATWQASGGAAYPVAINVPPSVAAAEGFAERLDAVCRDHGIAPSSIEVELSENQDLARFPSIAKVVQRLRARGVNVAMDDFGTGFACLAALGPISFGTVKIAKELLAEAPHNADARTVFSSVLALMARLKLSVVVEGVETAAQAQWLAQWPHAFAQGFYLARPAFGIGKVPGARRIRPVDMKQHRVVPLADAA
ncbi:EAL domain-containing protein [Caballeronia sp. LZ062]|uniref:EAL domain-containing protein n=1 Tax=unclassified Caballeronia TaxID=2646786 RepID=UPI002858D463|nr:MULTISPECIES: EAL domain-containing protein [unclassified Caballeronia]MDR5856505.1 EAL domain-containing protein [Caballeronia sp. LZ050]MDR5873175.1 EAL domain-containing protein [Caballeronia sp. LZ062]